MKGESIIVTGATGNLGAVLVDKLLRGGYTVSAIVSHGKKLPEQQNLFFYNADLIKEIESTSVVEKIISDHKVIHGAVLTVGGFAMGTIEKTSADDIHKMFALNFSTAYNVVKPLLHHFKALKAGKIVLVGSRTALEHGAGANAIAYSLSKSLLFKLAELINTHYDDVKVSVIVPNIIDTPENRKDMPDADFSAWIKPETIAEVILEILEGKRGDEIVKLY